MVRAVQNGSKSQTRRVVKWQGPKKHPHDFNLAFIDNPAGVKRLCVPYEHPNDGTPSIDSPAHRHYCPYGDPCDRLWVRETFWAYGHWEQRYSEKKGRKEWHFVDQTVAMDRIYQYSDPTPDNLRRHRRDSQPAWWKRPAIHMPRAASRIDLEITGVRVERLQNCSEADARAEGIVTFREADKDGRRHFGLAGDKGEGRPTAYRAYRDLWESINGPGSWDANPWVWVIEFKVIKPKDEYEIPHFLRKIVQDHVKQQEAASNE
jgi:hypothetical protein